MIGFFVFTVSGIMKSEISFNDFVRDVYELCRGPNPAYCDL